MSAVEGRMMGALNRGRVGTFTSIADMRSLTWQDEGRCKGYSPDTFHPVGNKYTKAEREKIAKAICSKCPVKRKCLEWSIETYTRDGVYGGLSEEERRPLFPGPQPRSPVRY